MITLGKTTHNRVLISATCQMSRKKKLEEPTSQYSFKKKGLKGFNTEQSCQRERKPNSQTQTAALDGFQRLGGKFHHCPTLNTAGRTSTENDCSNDNMMWEGKLIFHKYNNDYKQWFWETLADACIEEVTLLATSRAFRAMRT